MERVIGIGGVFFKSRDPAALKQWYVDNLGIQPDDGGYVSFGWTAQARAGKEAFTVWGPFPETTEYFNPSARPFMVNFCVADLDRMLAQLKANGCDVDEKTEEYEYGKFGWVMDPDGTRIELWEPPAA
jgi:predicted enzyme related to lactoylglutathione lyase